MRCATLLVVLVMVGSACRRGPEPEDVAKTFYQLSEIARQEGFGVLQEEFYGLLSTESRKVFEECGRLMGKELEVGGAEKRIDSVAAQRCLIFSSFEGQRGSFSTRRIASGRERVRLEITSGGTKRFMELVWEDGWKIDLDSTVKLNSG